jgi:hypothetical protein
MRGEPQSYVFYLENALTPFEERSFFPIKKSISPREMTQKPSKALSAKAHSRFAQ